jgi:hypothetical protein
MALRFRLPTLSRRGFSLVLSVAVLVLAALYLLYLRAPPPMDAAAVQEFRNTCMKSARHASGGGDMVMDEATEAKFGAYCSCLSETIESNVAPEEVGRLAQGTASDATLALLDRIVDGCKPKLE